MKSKLLLVTFLILTTTILFGCNTALPTAKPIHEQGTLPTPNVEAVLATSSLSTANITPNEDQMLLDNCQLALDIPWEFDETNPLTDENKIIEILQALGDLEECLFARQDGWLHNYAIQNGQRTEWEVLVHLIEGGSYVDLRYNLLYNKGQYTAKEYYDGRLPENQWCNITEDLEFMQVNRNCKTTEIYHLLTGNGKVDGYVVGFAHSFKIFKKTPRLSGYYQPKTWFIQENDAYFFVIEIKYDMSDVQGGKDAFDKPFTDKVRRHFIDLNTGRLTRYVKETGFKDGSFRVVTEDMFLLFYSELPEDIASSLSRID